jgi:hypothetical protein
MVDEMGGVYKRRCWDKNRGRGISPWVAGEGNTEWNGGKYNER